MYLLTQNFNEKKSEHINKMFCLAHTSQLYAIREGCFLKTGEKRNIKRKHALPKADYMQT